MQNVRFFKNCYQVAIDAAMPERHLSAVMPKPPKGRLVVVGAGKGAAQLAAAFENFYPHSIEGVVVTRYGFGATTKFIRVLEASHPLPDENSMNGANALLDAVKNLSADDLVVALITGGGSALLAAPIAPMILEDEITLNVALLKSGAPIGEMNILRRHVSQIKGGRLAKVAHPAKVVTYIVSDVPGDDPSEVASGPTVSGKSTPQDAMKVIEKYNLKLPENVLKALKSDDAHTPEINSEVHILASAFQSLEAVRVFAEDHGFAVINLGDAVEGEAREVARDHADFVRKQIAKGWKGLVISGGETTVMLKGNGRGGRNSEYALALAIALNGVKGVSFFAADTDGIDGSEDNAGVFGDSTTMAQMQEAGVDARAMLENNDAYSAFEAIGGIFAPGPSGTNVNDLRLILIE